MTIQSNTETQLSWTLLEPKNFKIAWHNKFDRLKFFLAMVIVN